MRMRSEALAWLAAASLATAACGKKDSEEASAADPAAGGEAPAATAPGATAPVAKPSAANPAAPANPFGSPDSEKGTPLPVRKPIAGSAKGDYDDGLQKAKQGDLVGARAEFDSAVKSDPNAFLPLHALGVISDREGKESQAIDYYRRALRVQPDYEESAAGVVAIYLRQGNSDKALQFMQPLAQQWERNLYLQAYYADLLTALNRPADAITTARAALRRDERFVPGMISLIRANLKSGKVELADSIIEQALGIDEKNAELHFIKGQRLVTDQRLGDALTEFRRAVELDPDYAEARMELALRLLAGANYDEALQQLQAVSKLTPKLVEVQLALGDAYRSKGQWENAKAAFDQALRMRSDLPQAHFNLALMYMTVANNASAAGATGPGTGYPGLDILTTYSKAKDEFAQYRTQMGSKITRDDPSSGYLDDIDKSIAREQKRLEREKKAAERAARTGAPAQ